MLEKAELRPESPAGAAPIRVLFNPTQYGLDGGNRYAETAFVGQTAPLVQYTGGNARSLSLELLFDTYEERADVRLHTDRVYALLAVEPTTHRPPIVRFAWGGFSFRALVERVSGRFTLFLESGVPVRATLSVSLKEYVDPRDGPRATRTESSDHAKTYLVRAGDSLASIAAAEYGDAALWRPIADANAIANPRTVAPGRRLAIPALPSRLGSA